MRAFEEPKLYDTLRRYLHFFRDHEALYDVTESLATVAVYRGRHALKCDFFQSFPCVFGMEQVCLQEHILFDMLFTYQLGDVGRYSAIVLAEQTCLSSAEIAAFRSYVESGGGLVITGCTGLVDERGRHRRVHPFQDMLEMPRVVFFPDCPERLSTPKRDHPPAYHDMRLPERHDAIRDAIRGVAGGPLPVSVDAGPYVAVDAYRLADGRRVIHLLNYDNEHVVEQVRVNVPGETDSESVRVLSPDGDGGGDVAFADGCLTIGPLQTYSLVVFG